MKRIAKGDFGQLMYSRRGFVAQVYGMLALQVALTALVGSYLRQHQAIYEKVHKYFLLWFILSIILIFVLGMVTMPPLAKLCVLSLFSCTMGLNCIAASTQVPESVIQVALLATLGIFVGMSVVGMLLLSLGVELNFLTYILLITLFGLIITYLVMLFVPVPKLVYKVILGFGITLFSIYVAYHTNIMIQPGHYLDATDASVGLYLDILNIFTHMVGFNN